MFKKYLVLFFLLSVLFFNPCSAARLSIAYWGDFHSSNLPEQVNVSGQTIQTGGAALLAGVLSSLRAEDPGVLILNTGNEFTGTPLSSMTKGQSQIKILNQIGIDAFLAGPSEFDHGWESLLEVTADAEFEILLSNVYRKDTRKPLFNPQTVMRRNGIDIAITGLIDPDFTKSVIREGVMGLVVTAYIDSIKQFVQINRESADLLIVMSQLGWEKDSILAAQVMGLDVIIGGGDNIDIYPPRLVNSTIIVQAAGFGQSVGRLVMDVDTSGGRVWNYEAELIKPVKGLVNPDEKTASLISKLEKKYTKRLNKQIGKLVTDWNVSQTEPSNLPQYVSDALHSVAPSVNLAVINNSSIGSGLKKGPILERDLWKICPNETPVIVFQMSGQELIYIINRQLNRNDKFLTWSSLNMTAVDGRLQMLEVMGYPVTNFDEFSVITTGFVWDHLYDLLGIRQQAQNRPHFYIPGNQRDFLIETIKGHRVISTALDNRWDIR